MVLFLALVSSWAAIVGVIFTLGEKLDSWMGEDYRLRLGRWLGQKLGQDPKSWLQSANQLFLQTFDRLYGGSSSLLEQTVWLGLVIALVALGILRIASAASEAPEAENTELLLSAMVIAFAFAAFGLTAAASIRGIGFDFPGVIARIVGVIVGIVGVIVGVIVFAIVGHIVGVIVVGFNGVFVGGIFGGIFGIIVGGIGESRLKIPIHPLRALLWSVVFVCIVGLIRWDAGIAGVKAVYADPKVLTFLAFNVFADGVSLLESRWVLQRSAKASLRGLAGLVLLDLMASATIYLILPTVLWPQILEFGDAVLFRGDRSWLGILFWTTLSTSVLFYLFVAAALLVRPLATGFTVFGWLSTPFGLEYHPVRCLAVAAVIVVTVAFLAGGIVQAV
jgi:hypothetical protein